MPNFAALLCDAKVYNPDQLAAWGKQIPVIFDGAKIIELIWLEPNLFYIPSMNSFSSKPQFSVRWQHPADPLPGKTYLDEGWISVWFDESNFFAKFGDTKSPLDDDLLLFGTSSRYFREMQLASTWEKKRSYGEEVLVHAAKGNDTDKTYVSFEIDLI